MFLTLLKFFVLLKLFQFKNNDGTTYDLLVLIGSDRGEHGLGECYTGRGGHEGGDWGNVDHRLVTVH